MNNFTITWGSGYQEPIWKSGSYQVVEHKKDSTFIYYRTTDNVI